MEETNKGYVFSVCDEYDAPYIRNALHIERNDSLIPWAYQTDWDAAKAAERDGVCLIYGMEGVKDGIYLDTPENRAVITDSLEDERRFYEEEAKRPQPGIMESIRLYEKQIEMERMTAPPAADRITSDRGDR